MKLFITTLLIFLITSSKSQNQNNIWYFGAKGGIDFSTTPPSVLNDGVMSHAEGVSSICDVNGDLLFFTNGIDVWNANKQKMPNGFGLLGNNSSSQIIIVPKPGDCDIYYIFTVPSQSATEPLSYSEVDMKLNGGYGDVVNKNIILRKNVTERITATLQSNGVDYWVVAQALGSFNFLSYAVTSAGVNLNPVVSSIEDDIYSSNDVIGCMKISPLGNLLCYGSETGLHQTHLFKFNNATGIASNNFVLYDSAAYGVEFSEDGRKLYLAKYSNLKLLQYDLSLMDNNSIKNSEIVIAYSPDNESKYGGALQIGVDKKIYLARTGENFLDVINSPNISGAACNYTVNGLSLNGKISTAGLCNQIKKFGATSYCGGLKATYLHTTPCNQNDITITVNAYFGVPPYQYSIDGTTYQNANIFSGLPNADYIISVKDANALLRKINLAIPITSFISINTSIVKYPECGENKGTIQLNVQNGLPPYLYSNDGIAFQTDSSFIDLEAGLINFTVKDFKGCTKTKSFNLIQINNLKVFAGRDTGIFINQDIQLHAIDISNANFSSYEWSPNYGLNNPYIKNPTAIIDRDIDYFLKATNQLGCTAFDTIHIDVYKEIGIFVPSAFTPNNDYQNDVIKVIPRGMNALNYFKIYNRYGNLIFYSTNFAIGWDGKINGIPQNSGSYTWIAEGIDKNGSIISKKGVFSLLR